MTFIFQVLNEVDRMAGVPVGVRMAEVRDRYNKILKNAADLTGCSEGTSMLILELEFVVCSG